MQKAFVPDKLHDAAFRCERAAQNRDTALFLERIRDRANHFLAGSFVRVANFLEKVLAGNREAIFQQSSFLKPLAEQTHAARRGHIGSGEAAAGFEIGQHRSLLRESVEFIEGERHARVAGDGQQMQHAVRRAASSQHRRDRIT